MIDDVVKGLGLLCSDCERERRRMKKGAKIQKCRDLDSRVERNAAIEAGESTGMIDEVLTRWLRSRFDFEVSIHPPHRRSIRLRPMYKYKNRLLPSEVLTLAQRRCWKVSRMMEGENREELERAVGIVNETIQRRSTSEDKV